jgi:hypothetical protein
MHFIGISLALISKYSIFDNLLGFAGSGAADGISISGYEIYGPMMFIILG